MMSPQTVDIQDSHLSSNKKQTGTKIQEKEGGKVLPKLPKSRKGCVYAIPPLYS